MVARRLIKMLFVTPLVLLALGALGLSLVAHTQLVAHASPSSSTPLSSSAGEPDLLTLALMGGQELLYVSGLATMLALAVVLVTRNEGDAEA
jgi:hypothetical protein